MDNFVAELTSAETEGIAIDKKWHEIHNLLFSKLQPL